MVTDYGPLGAGFLGSEIYEFNHYVHEFHHTFTSSAFGSAFYTLVGFHGGHVAFGLIVDHYSDGSECRSGVNLI